MKFKLVLAMAALGLFAARPVHAQHGHGGGTSGHASSHSSSSHGESEANEHGDKHGDADDHSGKHDGDHSHGGSIAAKLAKNTQLASKLQSLLPPGTNLTTASQGFKNLGQFVAAVHVASNLGIPFDQLKAKLTGPNAESLGKAIQELKPGVDAKAALKQAEKQAKLDLKSTDHDAGLDNDKDDSKKHS